VPHVYIMGTRKLCRAQSDIIYTRRYAVYIHVYIHVYIILLCALHNIRVSTHMCVSLCLFLALVSIYIGVPL